MRHLLTRWGLAALAWFALVPVVQAQFVVFSVQSTDAALDQMRHTLKLAGKEEEAKQIDGMLKAYFQDDGFKGIDTKRPLGFYLGKFDKPDPNKPPVVAFIPVTNEQEFLDLIAKFGVTVSEADKSGKRTIDVPGNTVHLRFSHRYVFATVDEEQMRDTMPDPAQFLSDTNRNHLFAVTANLERMPESLKKQIVDGLAKEMAKQPEQERDQDRANRLMAQKLVMDGIRQLLEETREISATLHHDRQAGKVRLDFSLTPRPGTKLAEQIKGYGKGHSMFAALAEDSAMNVFMYVPIAPETRANMDKVLEDTFQNALKGEKSFAKRAMAEKAFAVLGPTLKSDVFDLFATVRGPRDNGKYTLLAGLRVKNGQEIEQLVKNLLNDIPEKDRANVQLDAEKVDGLSIHKLKFPDEDGDGARLFGATQAYMVFHKDYVLFALGEDGLVELKRALGQVNKPGRGQQAPLQMTFAVRRLLHFQSDEGQRTKMLAAAKEAFTDEGQDLIQVHWTGDRTLRLRFEMSEQLFKFMALLAEDSGE
jgi:hypothetical protein